MNTNRNTLVINTLCILLFAGLLFYGSFLLFSMAYISVFVFAICRTAMQHSKRRVKLYLILSYSMVLVFQMTANVNVVFGYSESLADILFRRLFGIIVLLIPLLVSRYVSVGKYARLYPPSVQDITTISFAELNSYTQEVLDTALIFDEASKRLSKDNLIEIINDLPRHSSFKYINNGSLTDGYFAEAEASMTDPYIYIVISNTGSAQSDIITLFTKKRFTHASLSFDYDLKTIVGYNGGEKVYPPGLNQDIIEYYSEKSDASMIVYKLPCTREQKEIMLDKIREINQKGSAYNLVGLVFKYSHKPNIMYCSQFVYEMLKLAGLSYFDAKKRTVQPTELVELDYYRRLEFAYEIMLGAPHFEKDS